MSAKYYVGCNGWHYEHWRVLYYPEKLPKPEWLPFYARQFTTVELNNSFYRLPSEKAFTAWRESTPENFIFAVKVSRFITHINESIHHAHKKVKEFRFRSGELSISGWVFGRKTGSLAISTASQHEAQR